jgi:hypothetical protein
MVRWVNGLLSGLSILVFVFTPLVPSLVPSWSGKGRPTLKAAMILVAVIALALAGFVQEPSNPPILHVVAGWAIYATPIIFIALYVPPQWESACLALWLFVAIGFLVTLLILA